MASQAQAGVIIQPSGATTDMGSNTGNPSLTVDQSGLNPGYATGSEDFDAYIASNPTHNISGSSWSSSIGTTTGNFDFNLGGPFLIESFVLWNVGGNATSNIIGFSLFADDESTFTGATFLGSFTANPNTGPSNATLPQVFTFNPTGASFVRMQITSNNGDTQGTGFGEAAFEAAIPEPSSFALVGLCAAGLGTVVYRKKRKATQAVS